MYFKCIAISDGGINDILWDLFLRFSMVCVVMLVLNLVWRLLRSFLLAYSLAGNITMLIILNFFVVTFIPSMRGKKLLMLNKYTYSCIRPYSDGGGRWRCSMRPSRNCIAYVKIKNGKIHEVCDIHTHEPPRYLVTDAGKYIKI